MKPMSLMHIGLLGLALVNMLPIIQVENSWGISSLVFAGALLSCLLAKPEGGTRLPSDAVYAMVGIASLYLLYEMFWPHEEPTIYIIDLAHFMIFLGCCKFFELRTHRDAALVMVISALLVLISAFVTASPLFGIVVVIDITLGVAWLLAFQSQRDAEIVLERRKLDWRRAGVGPPPAEPEWNRSAVGGYVGTTVWCSAGLAVMGLLLFVAIPRGVGRGFFGRIQGVMPAAVTGFTDQIQLGETPMFEDETPVMRVRIRSTRRNFKPEDYQPYMRGMTFERYDQGGWHPLRKSPRLVETAPEGALTELSELADRASEDRIIVQEISLEHLSAGCLFSTYPPLAIATRDLKSVKIDQTDLSLQTEDHPRGGIDYTILSLAAPEKGELTKLDPLPPKRTRPGSVSLIAPEVRRFARSFFARYGDASDPKQRERLVRRACEFLTSGAYQYTLSRGRQVRGVDPIQDFLFENKRGHCEYFASALAVLCQAVDIPARLVNGYYGGDYNSIGGYRQFRQNDAHAWVEVYLPDRGWVTFDPSPANPTRDAAEDDGLWSRSQRWMDYLQFKWSSLVSFDADSRYHLVDRVTAWLGRLNESGDHGPATLSSTILAFLWGPELLSLWQRCFYWLLLLLCLMFVILTMRVLAILSLMAKERLAFGRQRPGWQWARRTDARFYDRLLLLLANKGHVKAASASPREFALELARSYRDLAELPRLTEWFYEVQYGHRTLEREQAAHVKEFLQRLREDSPFGTR